MIHRVLLSLALLASSSAAAAEVRVERDVAYVVDGHALQKLDVYAPADAKDLPVVVWIHGGGWRQGDKGPMHEKPRAFCDRGYVVASINYRLCPDVNIKEMMADVAKSIRWVRDHAQEYGGDPERLFVMGHSAGAHLAALVCTDDRYLKAAGVPLAAVRGCVPVDVAVFDIPHRVAETEGMPRYANYKLVFGETTETQRDVSPIAHVANDKHIPAFLILHVADRPETKAQSHRFADRLNAAGIDASVAAGEGKTHGSINSELGLADDEVTKAVMAFVEKHAKK